MIGWENTLSRDYAEAVVNGRLDADIDRMIETLRERRLAATHPICPVCTTPLTSRHVHDDVAIMPL